MKRYLHIKFVQYLKDNYLYDDSHFISKSEDYGSYEGIVHSDFDKIRNWFFKRKIEFDTYKDFIKTPIAFLNNINVDEDYRGQGLGNELYNSFEEECYENDAKCIFLESDNGENQLDGFDLDKWYESLDFEKIGVESGNSIMIKIL